MNRPTSPNHPGRDNANNANNANNAALRGASLAFQKSNAVAKPAPISNPHHNNNNNNNNNNNGALIAATSASRDHSLARLRSLSHQTSGGTGGPGRPHDLGSAHPSTDPRSSSRIAASLAASRSSSPTTRKTTPSMQPHDSTNTHQQLATPKRRKGSLANGSGAGTGAGAGAVSSAPNLTLTTDDSNSIASTSASVSSLDKRKETRTDLVRETSSARKGVRAGLPPLTPPRTMSPVVTYTNSPTRLGTSFACERVRDMAPRPSYSMDRPRSAHDAGYNINLEIERRRPVPPPARRKPHTETPASTTSSLDDPKKKPPSVTSPPETGQRADKLPVAPRPRSVSSQNPVKVLASKSHEVVDHPPSELGARRHISEPKTNPPQDRSIAKEEKPKISVRRSSSTQSDDTFVSASSSPEPRSDPPPPPPPPRTSEPSSKSSKSSQPTRPLTGVPVLPPRLPNPRRSKPSSNLSLESLTNAIVAGSLASARAAPSSVRSRTPPPPRPPPRIRQTLRAPRAKSEDLDGVKPQHRKKPLGKFGSRKKHAHHEGARKRWRDEITARQKQRYEGVWASNRGLLLDRLSASAAAAVGSKDVDMSQFVVNVVVRDIWARSRLPFDELSEVWDLVDTRGKGVLEKSEFVVGMWLIDQRLRGRKIPRRVSESVWGSARGQVRVMEPKGRGRGRK
ncbi:hypothetical protein GGR50DRAFT_662720 [Xylaria sp. CBS 124048]|nr:hypothetical protein GGR50DRAFT_662720 [Xylaria sp. CBS 124048]